MCESERERESLHLGVVTISVQYLSLAVTAEFPDVFGVCEEQLAAISN